MAIKTKDTKSTQATFRYDAEDLRPRDAETERASLEAYLDRNNQALEASIARAREGFDRGTYYTLDQVMADIDAQRQRRRASKE